MKSLKSKIAAFTLSEMLVVLLLTVIVVGLAFTILNLVQKQMYTAKDNFETGTELNQLKQALWVDFRTYSDIRLENESLVLKNEIRQIQYEFAKDYILRSKDTFHLNIEVKQFFFEGDEVFSGLINGVSLLSDKRSGGKKVFVYRENGANIYMNN